MTIFNVFNIVGLTTIPKFTYISVTLFIVYIIKTSSEIRQSLPTCFNCRKIFAMIRSKQYNKLPHVQKMKNLIFRDQNQSSATTIHLVWENHWYIIVLDMKETWWKYVLLEQKLQVIDILTSYYSL